MDDLRPRDLTALAARLPPRPHTRFAPSPTGYLHLGHVVNAIYVWGLARALDGRVLLRIENHDHLRSRQTYDAAILEDLHWLGFEADEGPVRQNDDPAPYSAALDRLANTQRVFVCDCSRREIMPASRAYAGRCRDRGLAQAAGRGLRVVIAPGVEQFDDALMGRQEQVPVEQCGDLLIRDRDGHWTYQFAVVVDDLRQQVDLVIRGADLLSSTGRQIRLARMLGRVDAPVFAHHPLIVKSSGEKLSKSSGDTGVRELRAAGLSGADVIGRAAAAVGLTNAPLPIDAAAVSRLFV